MRFFLLLLLSFSTLFAGDPPAAEAKLPADVQKVVDERDAAVAKAKAVFDAAQAKATTEAIAKLEKVVVAITKKGDLANATAIQKLVDEYKAGLPDLLGKKPETKIDLEEAIVGVKWKFYWQGLGGENKIMRFARKGVISEGSNFGENSYRIKDGVLQLLNQNGGIHSTLTLRADGNLESGDTSESTWKGKCFLIKAEK
jgi:hypothetical protein